MQREIEDAAFEHERLLEAGERVVVGVNRYEEADDEEIEFHRLDPESERRCTRAQRLHTRRARRRCGGARARLGAWRGARRGQPARSDGQRRPRREVHRGRDLQRSARGIRDVRRASRALSACQERGAARSSRHGLAFHRLSGEPASGQGERRTRPARSTAVLDRYFESDDGSPCYALFDGGHGGSSPTNSARRRSC